MHTVDLSGTVVRVLDDVSADDPALAELRRSIRRGRRRRRGAHGVSVSAQLSSAQIEVLRSVLMSERKRLAAIGDEVVEGGLWSPELRHENYDPTRSVADAIDHALAKLP